MPLDVVSLLAIAAGAPAALKTGADVVSIFKSVQDIKDGFDGDSDVFHQLIRELYTEVDRNLEILDRLDLDGPKPAGDSEGCVVACSFLQTHKHAQLLFVLKALPDKTKTAMQTKIALHGPDAHASDDDEEERAPVVRTLDNALNYVIVKSDAVRQLAVMRHAGVSLKPVHWSRRLRHIRQQERALLEVLRQQEAVEDVDWRRSEEAPRGMMERLGQFMSQ